MIEDTYAPQKSTAQTQLSPETIIKDKQHNKADSILIVSGGMDSITMLYEYRERIAIALSFDYGSNHNAKEIPLAKMHCRRLDIPHITIPLKFMADHFKSSLLKGADAIPEGDYNAHNMQSTVVPFRNGIMLSIATGMAESHNLKYVMMANHGGDHTIYPDCRPEFVRVMSEAAKTGTYADIEIMAPYTNMTKTNIALRGKQMGLDYAETWSCYKGGTIHCGKCGTCRERIAALKAAGIDDHTVYEE